MNDAQSHASLLLLTVMVVPWLIDRLFTWMERRAEMHRALERRLCAAEMATWAAKYPNSCSSYTVPSFVVELLQYLAGERDHFHGSGGAR